MMRKQPVWCYIQQIYKKNWDETRREKFIQVEIFNEGGNSEHEEDTDQEVVNEAGGSEWTEII